MRHLIINWIQVSEKEIIVGATDSFRWEDERSTGKYSGADCKTHVWVTITENQGRSTPTEEVGLFAGRTEDIYELALSGIAELSEIAWKIKNRGYDEAKAKEIYFGYALTEREIYQASNHLIVNSIHIDEAFIKIFATDSERWDYERSMADSGANATSHLCVSLEDMGKRWVIIQKIELFPSDERALAIVSIGKLLDIAWDIKEKGLDRLQAKEGYFGYAIH
jgi:hypothetical protein